MLSDLSVGWEMILKVLKKNKIKHFYLTKDMSPK